MSKLLIKTNEFSDSFYTSISNLNTENSGFDLYCVRDQMIEAKSTIYINFEICCQLLNEKVDENSNNYSAYLLMPISSIVKTPLRIANSVGLIDKNYTGQIKAYVDNISLTSFEIKKGTRLFQIVKSNLEPIHSVEIVNELRSTYRGNGGFGSTG